MTFKAKTVTKTKAPILDPDVYPGRLVQVIDLGLQPQKPFKGEPKDPVRMVNVTYELVTEFVPDEDGNPDPSKPRWISESFPFYSLNADKAKSTQRYLSIDPTKKYDGDWEAILGEDCLVQITQYEYEGNTRNGVGSLAPTMKGFDVPPLVNETKLFTLDDPDLEVYRSLPDWLQEKIATNLEFRGSKLEGLLAGGEPPKDEEAPFDVDEDLPV